MARVNGWQCDGCGTFEKGQSGDQRDPGPFMPKNWVGGVALCLCDLCVNKVRTGALRK